MAFPGGNQPISRKPDGESGIRLLFPGAALIGLIFVIFAVAQILTKRPWVDEAWFTGPALDLASRGRFGTLLLDPAGSHLRLYDSHAFLLGINQHTYWAAPQIGRASCRERV